MLDDTSLFDLEETNNLDNIITNIVRLRDLINWDFFIFLDNSSIKHAGILDMAKELNDLGPHGHPLKKSHKLFADCLKNFSL